MSSGKERCDLMKKKGYYIVILWGKTSVKNQRYGSTIVVLSRAKGPEKRACMWAYTQAIACLGAYFLRFCDFLLALCSRYLAFWRALPDPCAPVMYFFFLAFVFTLSSPPLLFFGAPLKTMPVSMISSISLMLAY